MDLRFLVASMSMEEVKLLSSIVYDRIKKDSSDRMKKFDYCLNLEELNFVHEGKPVDAIKSIRLRFDLALQDAKTLVDEYQERYLLEKKAEENKKKKERGW